ncbi:unnamed protein product [Brachionus calyciflorus]|uniref:Uncharacterized protein n=1 Tax=Brachionus calyciflorus TaxID=104777 RepID=A0A814MDR1_9BILA|nr:unnamed protein product [Brachionus calyciflorus]
MAHTVVNITDFGFVEGVEKGTKDLFFRTFWKPHDLPGVPKGYYDPLWVYAGDMVPLKDSSKDDDPDCRELIKDCLRKKNKEDKNKCETWLMENNFDYKLDDHFEDEAIFQMELSNKRKVPKERKERRKQKK